MKTVLVTGGAGFIGSHFVEMLAQRHRQIVVLDLLTYAGHLANLDSVSKSIVFVQGDICDTRLVRSLLKEHDVDAVVNFAAESHVDRSIESPGSFLRTNAFGVLSLLEASLEHWSGLPEERRNRFKFVQVSTDEVFGALGETGKFTEKSSYAPNSPYSASKASGDHLARAWYHTYKLPVVITNCSNNYGPKQFPEKLIPHMIDCALAGRPLPVYGDGRNVRDWIHVTDHCQGVMLALENGVSGESYCFGGASERRNLHVVQAICAELDRQAPRPSGGSYSEQITFVEDRKGHDWRYAIDDAKASRELGFIRRFANFEEGLKQAVRWYLENQAWVAAVKGKKS